MMEVLNSILGNQSQMQNQIDEMYNYDDSQPDQFDNDNYDTAPYGDSTEPKYFQDNNSATDPNDVECSDTKSSVFFANMAQLFTKKEKNSLSVDSELAEIYNGVFSEGLSGTLIEDLDSELLRPDMLCKQFGVQYQKHLLGLFRL